MAFTKLNKNMNDLVLCLSRKMNIDEINQIHHLDYLNIFYLNIRSFNKNNNELKFYLDDFKFKFDIIILVEIWANFDFSTNKYWDGFNLYYTTNPENKNAGVAVYTKVNLKMCSLDSIEYFYPMDNKNIDVIGLKFNINLQKFAIFGIYNHHTNKSEFFKQTILNIINKFKSDFKIILAGDLNINLLKYGTDIPTTDFVDSLIENNVGFVVDTPTRITPNTSTIIDNFLIHGFKVCDEILYANLNCKITDHNALILCIKLSTTKVDKFYIKMRPFNKKLIPNFNSNFKKDFIITQTSLGLNKLLNTNENFFSKDFNFDAFASKVKLDIVILDNMFHKFSSLLIDIQNNWFPIVTVTIDKKPKKDWFNSEIKLLIKAKNKCYKTWKKFGSLNPNLKNKYIESKNQCTKAIRIAKNKFLSGKLLYLKKDSKTRLQFLNKTLNRKPDQYNHIPEITYNFVNRCKL